MCPENPMGYVLLGWVYHHDYWLGNTKSPQETLEKAMELAQKALAMDDSMADAHALLGGYIFLKGSMTRRLPRGNGPWPFTPVGRISFTIMPESNLAGRPEEAIPLYQKAIRLNPFGPSGLYRDFGDALRNTGRFEEAVSAYKKSIQIAPDNILTHLGLAATYSMMGREKEARAEAAEVLRINPKFSLDSLQRQFHIRINR